MATSINIESNSSGIFIIDNVGIRSTEPIELKSSHWEGNTLKIEGPPNSSNMVISNGNIVTSNSNFTSNSNIVISNGNNMFGIFGRANNISIGGMHDGNEYVTIGDVRYKREGSVSNSNKKIFSENWSETGKTDVFLEGISISGGGKYHVNCSLGETCDIDNCGSGDIDICGNHQKSFLTISLVGSGDIRGNGIFNKISANLNGSGDINGFHAIKQLRVRLVGSGDIKITHDPDCSVQKNKIGSGDIKLYSRTYK